MIDYNVITMKWCIFLVVVVLLVNTGPTYARGRIFKGFNATEGQFPSLVRLSAYLPNNVGSMSCSGSLIGSEWVLTAAHCVTKSIEEDGDLILAEIVLIFAGQMTLNDDDIKTYVNDQRYIIPHPAYDEYAAINDIALIKTPKVDWGSNTKPANIGSCGNYVNKRVQIAGWGILQPDSTTMTQHPQWNNFTIMDNSYCTLRSDGVWNLLKSQLCVYAKGTSPCQGDSGGPALLGNKVIGVNSFISKKGCGKDSPMVSTNVTYYYKWIYKHTKILAKDEGVCKY